MSLTIEKRRNGTNQGYALDQTGKIEMNGNWELLKMNRYAEMNGSVYCTFVIIPSIFQFEG
jgi:hypothetical protein